MRKESVMARSAGPVSLAGAVFRRCRSPVIGLVACCFSAGCVGPSVEHSLYNSARAASVSVLVAGRHRSSGFLADPGGVVVTAAHAVKSVSEPIEVISPILGRQKAERVALDLEHDLALLRLPERAEPYPTLRLAAKMPPPGSRVFLFGDPVFRQGLLLAGSVAVADPMYCYSKPMGCYTPMYYISGATPEGTSGGCWVDEKGRVVGVQSAYVNAPKGPAGIACVGGPDAIRKLMAGKHSTNIATLGTLLDELWTQPEGFISRFPKGTAGVVTTAPDKDGPVNRAGLTKESLITAINGVKVSYVNDVMAIVSAGKPGDELTIEVMDPDNESKRAVKVRLGKVGDNQ